MIKSNIQRTSTTEATTTTTIDHPPSPPMAVTPTIPRDGSSEYSIKSSSSSSPPIYKATNQSLKISVPNPSVPKKLTLSSFFKPETAVRLTDAPLDQSIRKDYDFESGHGRVLGHGASSTVRLAKHRKTGRLVAIKSIPKFELLQRRGSYSESSKKGSSKIQEWEVLSYLQSKSTNHDSIVEFIGVYETDTKVHLVMEYCAGGELFDAIQRRGRKVLSSTPTDAPSDAPMTAPTSAGRKRARPSSQKEDKPRPSGYTECQAAYLGHQILSALTHLHDHNIVHRDIKPENILLVSEDDNDLRVKLSDFGTARVLHSNVSTLPRSPDPTTASSPTTPPHVRRLRAYSRVGSDYYSAPEVDLGHGYDTAVDVYSLGVTLFILLSGVPPTNTSTTPRLRCGSVVLDDDEDSSSTCSSSSENRSINDHSHCMTTNIEFPSNQWRDVSASAKHLLKRMLHPLPQCRITATEALEHEWIVKNVSKKVSLDLLHKDPTTSTLDPSHRRKRRKKHCDNMIGIAGYGI